MIGKSIRPLASAAAALLVLGAATACEPPAPPPSFVVNTTTVGPDAVPGDGICEITPGAGDCSLEAAIQEGNALGRADIHLAASGHTIPTVTITGEIAVTGSGTHLDPAFTTLSGGPIDVAPGGRLTLDSLTTGVGISVEGLFVGRRLYMFWPEGPVPSDPHVQVHAGGTAFLENTILPGILELPALHNSGVVILNHTTVFSSIQGGQALHNAGTVHAAASYLDNCSGTPPVSLGYNAAGDGSCELDSPTDVSPTAPSINGSFRWYFFMYTLSPDSPMLDAIPEGVNGCGTTVTDDMDRRARPYDNYGTSGCDIGALEQTPFP